MSGLRHADAGGHGTPYPARELLRTVKEEAGRQRIQKLLAQEQQKQKDAGDKVEE